MGFRGPEGEKEGALVIAARTTHVAGCRLRIYWRIQTPYKKPRSRKIYLGNTRVMAVTFKMKNWYLIDRSDSRGRGEQSASSGQTDRGVIDEELTLMTVHMHFSFAKKDFSGNAPGAGTDWENKWVKWWDDLAEYIVKFKVRILTGDFNMALFRVVPELRARRIPANMVASYMFTDSRNQLKIDSTAIFIIGPLAGATSLFDANMALGIPYPGIEFIGFKTKRFEDVKDEQGSVVGQRAWEIPWFASLGQGYLVSEYQDSRKVDEKCTKRARQCIK